jgi:group I intron endonuclease
VNWYGYVYKTTNLLNGKIYIGRRMGPFDRSYHGSGTILKRAVSLHGAHNFLTEALSWATDFKELCAMEIQHIRAFRQSLPSHMIYNIADGGLGGNSGFHHSMETRLMMSIDRAGEKNGMYGVHLSGSLNPMWGKRHSEKTRKLISEALAKNHGESHGNFGKVRSQETRNKISSSKTGVPNFKLRGRSLTEEHKKRLSETAKTRTGERNPFFGRHHSPETKEKISAAKRQGGQP